MDGRSLRTRCMGSVAHRVHTACVYPAIVEVEQSANGNRVIDCLVRVALRMQGFYVVPLNRMRLTIDLSNKPHQGFFRIRQARRLYIGKHALNQFLAAEQFRRDRGVRFRSKRTVIQMRGVRRDQLT